jgi:hypothetical protein
MTAEPHSVGTIRVVSKRKGGTAAAPGETVIEVDRENPTLGNRHVLHDHQNEDQRFRVVEQYERDFKADLDAGGPMSAEVARLAGLVSEGKRIALQCWCAPRRCHVDIVANEVRKLVGIQTVEPLKAVQPSLF